MTKKEIEKINKHLKTTNSGWWNLLQRYTDGSFVIVHGNDKRQYIKLLK